MTNFYQAFSYRIPKKTTTATLHKEPKSYKGSMGPTPSRKRGLAPKGPWGHRPLGPWDREPNNFDFMLDPGSDIFGSSWKFAARGSNRYFI